MHRSHICSGCGTDLSGTRAPPDPHYGLPIVVCPSCSMAVVRRPWLGRASKQTRLRFSGALRALAFRVFVVGAPLLLLGLMVAGWSEALAERRTWPWLVLTLPDDPGDLFMDNRLAGLVALLCCTLLSGLSLSLMTHWPKWVKMLAMLVGMLSFTAMQPLLYVLQWAGRRDVPFQTGVMVNLAKDDTLIRVGVVCALLFPLAAALLMMTSKLTLTPSRGRFARLRKLVLQGRPKLR